MLVLHLGQVALSTLSVITVNPGDDATIQRFKRPPTSQEIDSGNGCHTLMLMQYVEVRSEQEKSALSFWDLGCNVNMIRQGFAEAAGLVGQPALLNLVRSGGDVVQWSMKAYFVPLVDRAGNTRIILAQEMDKITETLEDISVAAVMKIFL